MQTDPHTPLRVLLIDDDEDDYIIFKLAITEVNIPVQLFYGNCADNISEVVAQTRPQLIFLDINLPRTNGIECLQALQNDSVGKTIPVVMYSSSELPRDLQLSFDAGASLYFRKPTDISRLVSSLRKIFAMNWEQPGMILAKYSTGGRYIAFADGEEAQPSDS